MFVSLKDCGANVEIIDSLSWGQKEEIQEAMLSGVKISKDNIDNRSDIALDASALSRAKYATLKVCIKHIDDKEGNEIKYTKEWAYNLSTEDGDTLFDAVNKITNPTSEDKKK